MKLYAWSFLLLAPATLPAQHLTIDDLLDAGNTREAGALLSPDGSTFASVQHGQIVLRPADGGEATPLTATPAPKSELSWSPDGKNLAFVSEGDVWTLPVHGGEAKRLTHDPAGPGDPRGATDHHPLWNPKGGWILYQSGRNGFNELYAVRSDGREEHQLAATEIYTGADALPAAGRALNNSQDHGDAVASDRFDPNPSWSPDGTRIVYTERSRPFFSGKLNVLPFDAKTGNAGPRRVLYTAKNDPGGAWSINTAAWLPDSRSLVVVLQESGWDKLWIISESDPKPRPLTTGTGEDENPVVSPDGRSVAFTSNRDLPEERHLWIVQVNGGSARRLTHLAGIESSPQWTDDSSRIYFTRGTALQPAASYVAGVSGAAEPRPLQPVPASKFCRARHHAGGRALPQQGRPSSGRTSCTSPRISMPASITHRHLRRMVDRKARPPSTLSPWSLFLADHGYVVLEPNFRGSTGYGERFRNSNVEDSGGGEIDDIATSVKYLVDAGIADPRRVAVSGGSHGGTVVANAVAKLPDTFAAGIEMFGVVDRALFLKYTNRNSAIRWETKMGGPPEAKPAVYRKADVLLEVSAIKTPLLILHGEQDPRCPRKSHRSLLPHSRPQGRPTTTTPILGKDIDSRNVSIAATPMSGSLHFSTSTCSIPEKRFTEDPGLRTSAKDWLPGQ